MSEDRLREALTAHEYVNGACTCGTWRLPSYTPKEVEAYKYPHDIRWALWKEHFITALAAAPEPAPALPPQRDLTEEEQRNLRAVYKKIYQKAAPEPSEEDRSLARGIYVAPMNRDGHHETEQLARLLARIRQWEREAKDLVREREEKANGH